MNTSAGVFRRNRGKRRLGILLFLLALSVAAFATIRSSASYRVPSDALTSGGGAASSTSYQSPQSATGAIAGGSQSANFQMQAGAVTPSQPPSRVDDWRSF